MPASGGTPQKGPATTEALLPILLKAMAKLLPDNSAALLRHMLITWHPTRILTARHLGWKAVQGKA